MVIPALYFEKKEIIDTNQIAALIDKAKEVEAVSKKEDNKITQSTKKKFICYII